MKTLEFTKMQGLGNDFIVIDLRKTPIELTPERVSRMADRRFGIGGDMVIAIDKSERGDAFMRSINADGSEIEACGNATRCIADVIMQETGKDKIVLETKAGLLACERAGKGKITADMGMAKTQWDQIPIAYERDTLNLRIEAGPFSNPVGVNMGNPHAVFFTNDVEKQKIENYGPQLETHPLFPQRANIEFAEVRDRQTIRMRVWERGVGITNACGSGACATAVAAIRRGLTDRKVTVIMDGGPLEIEWLENGHVLMTGAYEYVYQGQYFI